MMKILFYVFMLNFLVIFIKKKFLSFIEMNLIFLLSLIFMLINNNGLYWNNVYSWMGLDDLSYLMVLLTLLIIGMMFMASMLFKNIKFYSILILMLMNFLLISFMSMNYFIFYLFFEMSLIPTFFLILGWGYQPERIKASIYMLMYTMFASLPLLIIIFYLYNYFNSLSFFIILDSILNLGFNNLLMYIYMILAFLVKLPMFLFHLWLPKAHIEAPVTGSMILAGVLLKLGGYGLIRSMTIMLNLSLSYNYLLMGFCIMGMIYLSLSILSFLDLKLMVAYSSVVHMMIMLMGLLSMNSFGLLGSIYMMIGHAFCSSALFLLVNISYDRVKSRSIYLNKGMMVFLPTLSMWWFLFCVGNMSAPITLNLFSEILILISLMQWCFSLKFFLMFGMYFSSIYSLKLFSVSQHGMYSTLIKKIYPVKVNEYLNLIIHWLGLNFFIFLVDIF